MVLPFFMPDGGGSRNNTVPAYLRPTTRIPTTTAGETNRFRNIQQAPKPSSGISAAQRAANIAGAAAANRSKSQSVARMPVSQSGVAVPSYATNRPTMARADEINATVPPAQPRREVTTTQVSTPAAAPVQVTPAPTPVPSVTDPAPPPVQAPVQAPVEPEPEPEPYNVYDDPFYQQALQGAQSEFNLARADALATQQYQERPIQRQLEDRPRIAEEQRRRLAGNFAARGMGGGRYGALTRAEAETNAREISNRTGLREQIAELNRQFTSRFGAPGTDWTGTRFGMEAQQRALQSALQNRLAGLTTVG